METISISGFGGLKEATLETEPIRTAPITVFIGEQATGKSILAKLLYFFRGIGPQLPFLGGSDPTDEEKKNCIRDEFCALFPPPNWGDKGFEVSYESNGQFVRVWRADNIAQRTQHPVQVEWSAFYTEAATNWSRHLDEVDMASAGGADRFYRVRMDFLKQAKKALGPFGTSEQVFVPAGRESFARIGPNIFTMLDANKGDLRKSFDPILGGFLRKMEDYKKSFESVGFFDDQATQDGAWLIVRKRVESVLKAEYKREGDVDYLVHQDSRRVRLADASSGQQEALPLLLTLGRVLSGQNQERDVYFEEPEAHLFPNSQREIVELLAAAFNLNRDGVRFVITTHSPYILSVLDNLLQAGQRYASPEPDKKIGEIVPQVFALRPGDVAVYSLGNGKARLIMDPETKLIEADIIDNVSMEIDKQFDRLLWET
jgi:hypothetical protein